MRGPEMAVVQVFLIACETGVTARRSTETTAGDGAGCRFVFGAKRDIAGGGAGRDVAGLASQLAVIS